MSTWSLWVPKVKVIHWHWSKSLRFNIFKLLGRLKPNFMWRLLGMEEQKLVQMVQVTWSRWLPCPYMVKVFSGTERRMTLKLSMQHWVLECYQICSNDAPGLTLTYFMARSNLSPAFVWEKVKTMDFSETIVVYDVGRCSQLNEYMKLWVPKVRVIHWPCSKSLRFNILDFFSSITTDFNISLALRWPIQHQWSAVVFNVYFRGRGIYKLSNKFNQKRFW